MKKAIVLTMVIMAMTCGGLFASGANDWFGGLYIGADPGGSAEFGVRLGFTDGYDGEAYLAPQYLNTPAVYMLFYRQQGSGWTGTTGFYYEDYRSLIPQEGSKTWSDIYLWSHKDYNPVNGDYVRISYIPHIWPPVNYWALLVIDYVPESLNYTGPTEFFINLRKGPGCSVPIAKTDDPFNPMNVTRMHLTVYTTPVPEPSSLAALILGLGPVGIALIRRRK